MKKKASEIWDNPTFFRGAAMQSHEEKEPAFEEGDLFADTDPKHSEESSDGSEGF